MFSLPLGLGARRRRESSPFCCVHEFVSFPGIGKDPAILSKSDDYAFIKMTERSKEESNPPRGAGPERTENRQSCWARSHIAAPSGVAAPEHDLCLVPAQGTPRGSHPRAASRPRPPLPHAASSVYSLCLFSLESKGGETEERTSICWFSLQMPVTAKGWVSPKPGGQNPI